MAKARVFAGKEENEKGGKAKMLGINSVQSVRMKSGFKLAIIISSFLALLYACGAERSTPPGEISVTLTPSAANVYLDQSVQFTATVHNSTNGAVTWSLSGAGCSGPTCGTISDAGLYTAPESVPSPATVTVKATSVADTSKSDSAVVTILEAANVWTWVSGANTVYQAGIYGTKGTADPSNVPGARCGAASWIDSNGKLWLFGGRVYDFISGSGYLNDLWKYDPTTLEWTWVSGANTVDQAGIYGTKGTADPSNVPGARVMAVSWLDSSGKLWLFGGGGVDSLGNYGSLNDLWKYDPTTFEWTWVSGDNTVDQAGIYGTKGIADPSNVPGARRGAVSWIDSNGKLWLFGGQVYDSLSGFHCFNDLWKYDPTTFEWTWVSGANTVDQAGIYGTKGTADPSNVPGARAWAVSWLDSSGKLWLFGGTVYDFISGSGYLNDLWKYDPTTFEWTWVSGTNSLDQPGIYGTKGTADPSNVPGARAWAVSWLDSSGKLWLFGGGGTPADEHYGLNDLWKYDPITLEWTWVSGANTVDQPGIYGTKGTADPSNIPGGRYGAASWIDSQGKLWLFGGMAWDSGGSRGYINDLWKYIR